VSIAIDRRSGKWVVRWREGNRHRSRSFTLKRDAEIFERERQRARELGSLFLPDRGSQSLNDVVELWWTEHVLRSLQPTTRDGYLPVWGRHLRPALGAMPIRQLVVRRQRFIEPAVPAAIERLRAELLRTERLADASLVAALAYGGLRPGEALALRWADVGGRVLKVERAAAKGEVKVTKNSRLRTVRLVTPLALDLAWWRSITPWRNADAYVFPNSLGQVRNDFGWRNWRNRVFGPAVERVGVSIGRPYDLRHSFASLLIHEGRSLTDVAAQLGDSVTVAGDVYAHVFADVEDMPREPVAAAIERAREECGVRQMYVELGLFDAAEASKAALDQEADARTRTGDPFITSEVLYQLSYVGRGGPV
jgi:integrase